MSFNSLILIWFDANKRSLPWRGESDPYKIWISEIILQQTRVAQGAGYYCKFIEKFPNLNDLANADEQEVLKLWQGLGYYSRARNLHYTAKYIQNQLNGDFPNNYTDLLKLKGVGSYTAAAIASIAFGEPVPAIDGNAFRVFSRYFDIELDISDSKTKKYFFELGKEIIDTKRAGDFNEAVMELGATVCLPRNPDCQNCPLKDSCAALQKNKTDQLPVKTKKVKIKKRNFNFFEITDGKNLLMIKRTENDIWKNLYCFPFREEKMKNTDFFKLNKNRITLTHNENHLLTHQKLEICFWQIYADKEELKQLADEMDAEICSADKLNELPLPKPIEKYLKYKI